jgi:hypothetical protein
MNAEQILVAALTVAAVGWLVWAELHSRRNRARGEQTESAALKEEKNPEAQTRSHQVKA